MADAKFPDNFAKSWICTFLHCYAIIGQLNWRKELYIARIVPILFISSAQMGVSEPTYGTLIGSLDGDILHYECSGDSEINSLSCSFTQVLLTTNSSPEGLEDELASIPQMLADVSTFEGCEDLVANFEDAISRVERGEPMEDGRILDMDADELEYSKRLVASLAAMCSDRTAESLEALFRLTHEREAITCRPFVNDYRQTFTKVDDGLWVVDDGPTGQCGIVQVSRFEQSEGDGFLWEYTAQRVITNPSGVSETGMSCSVLSDEPVLYTWRSDAHRIDCTFIE
ncbi:hypothetical protein [Yoonia sp. R78084]|uniref:hypothetical protein n=1 Tax=Yoonia sp. R78084 TaxID=3093869 RepID=UPI0037DD929C